jgi:hypothetical protein
VAAPANARTDLRQLDAADILAAVISGWLRIRSRCV